MRRVRKFANMQIRKFANVNHSAAFHVKYFLKITYYFVMNSLWAKDAFKGYSGPAMQMKGLVSFVFANNTRQSTVTIVQLDLFKRMAFFIASGSCLTRRNSSTA
jgi:hypothetical protein